MALLCRRLRSGSKKRVWLLRRKRSRLRPIPEAVAYAHCHGDRGPDLVRVMKLEPRRPRYAFPASGETLRRAFESRLDTRKNQTASKRLADLNTPTGGSLEP